MDNNVTGDSPEAVAFALYQEIRRIQLSKDEGAAIDSDWILDTYALCLRTVRGPGKSALER